jgi:hypothetical protein
MNRIYIIGNGFDLSHGLPTGYNDFIAYLIKKEVNTFIDELPKKFTYNDLYHNYFGNFKINDPEMIKNYRDDTYFNLGDYELDYFKKIKSEINTSPIINLKKHFDLSTENEFINLILNPDDIMWGKIEIQYFELLKKYNKELKQIEINKIEKEKVIEKVNKINHNLGYLKNELILFLDKIQNNNTYDYNVSKLRSIFDKKLNFKTIINFKKLKRFLNKRFYTKMNNYLYLNFNYTNTFSYLSENKKHKSEIINIHGEIQNSEDVIFGFGDENTNKYKEIENSDDIFLENIKSFKYLKNNNYDKLIGFIDSDYFEVYLLGHSCSITDRVLLKKIFESTNCFSIKIIPKSGNDNERYQNHKEICFNIARIFDDNGMMRDKVIPFEDCDVHLPNYEKFEVKI